MRSPTPKKENLLLNLACNIAVPTFVLMKLSSEHRLGPVWALVVALVFPLAYGIYDFKVRKKTNLFSIIGLASVLLTGGFGLLKVDGMWFAVKEGAVPLVFGAAVLISVRTRRPLVREVLYNEQVIDVSKVDAALEQRGQRAEFERLLKRASIGLALSFLLSAILNFGLARYLLTSPAGTEEFNAQLGRMNMLNWPVIVLPSMVVTMFIFWQLMNGLTRLTGLELDEIFHTSRAKAQPSP
ncbi:MAG: VC0807 family protein [Opitutaceae bacterium]|nr:VC0807 family protein [Opitutaceae bacterium]